MLDSIGQVGVDPGTEWGTGLTSTADNTLRRKPAIDRRRHRPGSTRSTRPIEWDGFATDTFDGLGAHTVDGGGPVDAPAVADLRPPLLTCAGTAATAR